MRERPVHSAIYSGHLRHRRFRPGPHRFSYRVFMMYLDLDEIDAVLEKSRWWSKKAWRPARFRREDFHGDPALPLRQALLQTVHEATGCWHRGPIRMLANLRYFGYLINPISCYYCFDADERLRYIVVEVTNTPWKERQSYVLQCDPDSRFQRIQFDKAMHVSPFNPMDMRYRWCSNKPSELLNLNIEAEHDGETHTDATMVLKRREISAASLAGILWQFPWMTARVAAGIHWQALKLWLRGNPVYDHKPVVPRDDDSIVSR